MSVTKPDYELHEEFRQLALDLELPEVETDGVSPEEARLRSELAREQFEKGGQAKWFEEYQDLRNGGWPWRQAAYIAWAGSPRVGREPKTQDELARKVLGLTSDRAITTWRRRNPAIDEMVAVLQSAPLFKFRAEIYKALIDNAMSADYKTHNDRKLALEIMGDYIPASKIAAELTKHLGTDDLSNLSDEELMKLAAALKPVKTGDEKE
jgi:hypothetical protein